MRYLKTYEAKTNSNKHTIEEYIERSIYLISNNDLMIDDWSIHPHTTRNTQTVELTNKDISISLEMKKHDTFSNKYPFTKKTITNRNICIHYKTDEHTFFGICFSHSNMGKFDINEFLNESIRYVDNYLIYSSLRNYEECEDYIYENMITTNFRVFSDLIKFNNQVDIMKQKYSHYIDGEDMGLL